MKKKCGIGGKTLVLLLAAVLVVGCAMGGSLAWLTASTEPVTNTFTYGDINIDLAETTGETYHILPGNAIAKDPQVTVSGDSENCWLFVKAEQSGTFVSGKVTWEIAEGWNALEGVDGVFYREVAKSSGNQEFYVLKDNQITVSDTLTKEDIQSITTDPSLTITAYAVQRDSSITTAAQAWGIANPSA